MCYSGKCLFEDHMGNCQVWNYKEFKYRYGYPACQVGDSYEYDGPKDLTFYNEHKEEFKDIYKDYMKNRFKC